MTSQSHQGPEASSIAIALRACAAALEQLAVSFEESTRGNANDVPEPDRGSSWPEVMSTKLAATYCGYMTTSGLRKAHLDGKVFPVGRRGGVGSSTWARADLDRFLRGEPPVGGEDRKVAAVKAYPTDANELMPVARTPTGKSSRAPSAAERAGQRRSGVRAQRGKQGPHVEAALRRLDEIAKGPRTK